MKEASAILRVGEAKEGPRDRDPIDQKGFARPSVRPIRPFHSKKVGEGTKKGRLASTAIPNFSPLYRSL